MFHSNVAFAYCGGSNEFLRGGGGRRRAAAGLGSPCQAWARCRLGSTAAKLNLMFHSPQERCINQRLGFAWTVASNLIPCRNKPGHNMMSRGKQCNLRLPNKSKQQAGPFNSDCCSDVKYIIKNMAPSRPPLPFKERRGYSKSLILFPWTRKMKVWTFKINKNKQWLLMRQRQRQAGGKRSESYCRQLWW